MDNNKNIKLVLNKGWKFALYKSSRKLRDNKFIKINENNFFETTVPGTLHTDLMNHNIIDDPFFADNELNLAGISESDWIYINEFDFKILKDKKYQIIFDGIDTITEIHLNEKFIGNTDNMFRQYVFDISEHLNSGKNQLKIIFRSPIEYCKNQEDQHGILRESFNSPRAYLRKAQYSFGWDWGPIIPTSGIWKNAYIREIPKAEVSSLTFSTIRADEVEAEVELKLNLKINSNSNNPLKIIAELQNHKSKIQKDIFFENKAVLLNLKIPSPLLWFPNGEGHPNLYELTVKVIDNEGNTLDLKKRFVGIRTVELSKSKDGKPNFAFTVNGKNIFAKGVNWIPAHSFLTKVKRERYYSLLKAAKDANMNIIRVWGGGIYENDEFYEICDQLGLLVWQDFMFACSPYPDSDEFLNNVKEEVIYNVNRIQYHPSIALWCGNNENEWIWHQDTNKPITEMPGYKIFSELIPSTLKEIDRYANYWQSSPFGSDIDPNSFQSGNTHQWDIWSRWIDYLEVKKDTSLFVTEFGFQAPANISTFNKCLPEENRNYRDQLFEFHNKQVEGPERVIKFLSSHLPIKTEWEDFIYLTQLNQGLALKTCVEYWRTNNRTNGSIIWQINDCWPVTSWSLIDSDLIPKLSYYFVKQIFSPQLLSFNQDLPGRVSFINQSPHEFLGIIEIVILNTITGDINKTFSIKCNVSRYSSTFYVFKELASFSNDNIFIASVYDTEKKLLHRNFDIKKRWKHISLPKAKLKIKKIGNYKLSISSSPSALFVDIFHPEINFDPRGFILLPGEVAEINYEAQMEEFELSDLKLFTLNDYLI